MVLLHLLMVMYMMRYKDGKMDGHGTYTYADGRVETGTYNDGKFIG